MSLTMRAIDALHCTLNDRLRNCMKSQPNFCRLVHLCFLHRRLTLKYFFLDKDKDKDNAMIDSITTWEPLWTYLHFRQLRNPIHSDLTIESNTGQHSIFLQCVRPIFILVLFFTFTFNNISHLSVYSRQQDELVEHFWLPMDEQTGWEGGPLFLPWRSQELGEGQSRFIYFTFSPAGWKRGLCSSCRGGLVSWPQVPQEPSSACTFLQLCQHLCPHLLQTSARESLVWKLLEWFTNLWLYFNRCLAHHFLAKFGSHEMKIAKEHDCGQPGSFPCYILPSLFNLSKHMIDKVIIKVFGCCADLLIIFISRLAKRFFWSWALCPKTTTMVSRRSWSSGSFPSWAFREAEKW